MPHVWSSADIGIITLKKNISGAVPSKLYEAMACGIPIIILAHGEPSKIVRAQNVGMQ